MFRVEHTNYGPVAHLVERCIRIAEVSGSIPLEGYVITRNGDVCGQGGSRFA